jgi:hypothetical protein
VPVADYLFAALAVAGMTALPSDDLSEERHRPRPQLPA